LVIITVPVARDMQVQLQSVNTPAVNEHNKLNQASHSSAVGRGAQQAIADMRSHS
jgi:hypothetical protein